MTTTVLDKLFQNVHDLAAEVGKEIKATRTTIGNKTALTTAAKDDLVAAINEINGKSISPTDVKNALVDDLTPSVDKVYSSNKVDALVAEKVLEAKNAVKAEILDGAEESLDTLKELGEELKKDKTGVQALTEALGKKLTVEEQELTKEQKAQVQKNLGFDDLTDLDLLTPLNEGLPSV